MFMNGNVKKVITAKQLNVGSFKGREQANNNFNEVFQMHVFHQHKRHSRNVVRRQRWKMLRLLVATCHGKRKWVKKNHGSREVFSKLQNLLFQNSVMEGTNVNYQITKGICIYTWISHFFCFLSIFDYLFAFASALCFFVLGYLHAKRIGAYFCMELSFRTWNLDLLYIF